MIIAGNSHVTLFRNRLRDRSTGKIVKIKWVGALRASHFVYKSSAARAIRRAFETCDGWKILSIGMHDIFGLCRVYAQNHNQQAFDQLVRHYKSIFAECNRNGKFGWLISPQQLDGSGAHGLPEKTVFDISQNFNRVVSQWCKHQGILVINPLPQILDHNNKPKAELVQKDGIHLNDRALSQYVQLLAKHTDTDITCEPLPRACIHRVHAQTEPESLALLVADELGLDWDQSGMPAGQRETFEKKVLGYIAGRLNKKGMPNYLDRHTQYNRDGGLNTADLVDIYNHASDLFGHDINFDVNIRQLDTVNKISRFFMDQKPLTKNDFIETLTRDPDDSIRSSEIFAADSRIGKLDDTQYQSLKEMIHHQTGGVPCQYGVIYFWCALVEMKQGNYNFALALLDNSRSTDLEFPFRPSRMNHYWKVCNERRKLDRKGTFVSKEVLDSNDEFCRRSETLFAVEQYAATAADLLSAWCDQNSVQCKKIENLFAVSHKDDSQVYFRLFPNLKCLDLFIPVQEIFNQLSSKYRHDPRINVWSFLLSDRTGYNLLGFSKGNENSPLYYQRMDCEITNATIITTETMTIDDFHRNRADEKPDLLICTVRGLARHVVQSLSPDIQYSLKAVCLATRNHPRHLNVGCQNITAKAEPDQYVLFGSAPESQWDGRYRHAFFIKPNYADSLVKRRASLQRLLPEETSFRLLTMHNGQPKWIKKQAEAIVKELFEQGMKLLRNNQLQQAFSSFTKTIEIKSDHSMALLQIGLLLRRNGKARDALKYLVPAFAISPFDHAIAKACVETFRECGLKEKAQIVCRRYLAQYLHAASPPQSLFKKDTRPVALTVISKEDRNTSAKHDPEIQTWPTISIVTPSFNQSVYLEDCILSVLNQNYPFLEYIIMDGGSTDCSRKIIEKYAHRLKYWQSQPDEGQYAAIQDGFSRCSGDIMTWINSDDILQPDSLQRVAGIFMARQDVEWITGRPNSMYLDSSNQFVLPMLPLWSRKRYLDRHYHKPFIQQEGTFWRRSLWEKAGARMKPEMQYAGDLELWTRFFRHAALYSVDCRLATFRNHAQQKTASLQKRYFNEAEQILDAEIKRYQKERPQVLIPAPLPIIKQEIDRYVEKLNIN